MGKTPSVPWGLSIQWHSQRPARPWMFNELTTREKARLSIKMLHSVVIRIRLKSSASVFLPIQSSLCPALEVFRWAAERALFWRNWAFDRENMKVLLFACTPEDSYLQGCNKRTLMFIPGCSAEVKYNLITVLIWALVPPHYNSPGQLRCSRRRKRLIWFVKCFTSTGRGWRGGEKTNERGRDVQS